MDIENKLVNNSVDGQVPLVINRVSTVFINDHFQPTFIGLQLTLTQAGYNVVGSSSPYENDEILRNRSADCAVLDLDAPDRSMNIADLLTQRNIQFMFLGGHKVEDLGVHKNRRYINKPIGPQELLAEVEAMLKSME